MRQTFLVILLISIGSLANGQPFKVTGRITNALREPVAFVSVQVKELQSGTVSKEDGTYTLALEEGKYDIVFSIVGYKTQVVTLAITKDYVQNIILEEDRALLQNVTIKARYKDGAADIIRNVIRHKDSLLVAAGLWSCKVY
ncbi:MAG: carboxypeptidase-like regulatory domain-containing protein, partial [Segetibacter sp.]|nr:carboxypeptidase-like regulatory domain-containing protein [Segetibacter sp.]